MKLEWRKTEKQLYLPKEEPSLITVPTQTFFAFEGMGDPNGPAFAERMQALYTLAYTVRMMPKQGIIPEGYEEYTVYPLEGVWSLSEPWEEGTPLNKDNLVYTVMIRQPGFVTEGVFEMAKELAKKKKVPLLSQAMFAAYTDGLCVQMMHIGPYDDEPRSFARMEAFAKENGLRRTSKIHREIYLSDPRKVAEEVMKTVLRVGVERV